MPRALGSARLSGGMKRDEPILYAYFQVKIYSMSIPHMTEITIVFLCSVVSRKACHIFALNPPNKSHLRHSASDVSSFLPCT
jgi:hypothetical protein